MVSTAASASALVSICGTSTPVAPTFGRALYLRLEVLPNAADGAGANVFGGRTRPEHRLGGQRAALLVEDDEVEPGEPGHLGDDA